MASNSSPNPNIATAPPAWPGFDTDIYPGAAVMAQWKHASPYVFAAYYLHAPCHHDQSWMGHRAALVAMGWNLAPVYVGQQPAGVSPCRSANLTAAQGRLDALDCCSKLSSEGFPPRTFAYLDVEHCDAFPSGLHDYISAWIAGVVSGGFGPGVYCHAHNAVDVRAAVTAGWPVSAGAGPVPPPPRFWIAGGVIAKFDIHKSHPADSGIAFADLWQCPQSVTRTFGAAVDIDENCAALRDPAGPDAGPAPHAAATRAPAPSQPPTSTLAPRTPGPQTPGAPNSYPRAGAGIMPSGGSIR